MVRPGGRDADWDALLVALGNERWADALLVVQRIAAALPGDSALKARSDAVIAAALR